MAEGQYVTNKDGSWSQQVTQTGSKVTGPTLIATIPYSSFAASTTYSAWYRNSINRNAKARTFHVSNLLNQPFAASGKIILSDSAIQNGATGDLNAGSTQGIDAMAVGTAYTYPSSSTQALAANVDSVQINIPMGAAAPTSGNVYIYVTEVFG